MLADEHDSAIRSMIRRAQILSVDDAATQQRLGLSGFAFDRPPRAVRSQTYGFSSNPPVGGEGLILALGGRSDRAWFLGGEHPDHRPTNTPSGGSILYDSAGNLISAMVNGIKIRAAAGNVTVESQPGQKVFVGGDGVTGAYARVMTESGPSPFVYARYA